MRVDFSIDGEEKDISVFMDTLFGLANSSEAAYPVYEETEEPDDECGSCQYSDESICEAKEEAAKPKEIALADVYNHICSAVTASIGSIIHKYIHIPEKIDSKAFEITDKIIDAYSMSIAILITETLRNENRK